MMRELNKYAMQHGVIFGLYGVVSILVQRYSISMPWLGIVNWALMIYSVFLMIRLTKKYRSKVINPRLGFSFGNAYLHSLFTAFYSMLIIAAATYVYMAFIDGGEYTRQVVEVMQKEFQQSGAQGLPGMKEAMVQFKDVRPADYALSVIYVNVIIAPLMSLIVAAVCKKNPAFEDTENSQN